MFDRTDPADLAALKSEVNTDPIGMDYASVINVTAQLLKKLNDPAENVGGETIAQELTPAVLLDVIDTGEFSGPQVDQGERDLLLMMFAADMFGAVSLETNRAKIKSLFQSNGSTNNAIDALTRPLSRAEVLFGAGTVISRQDWIAARDS